LSKAVSTQNKPSMFKSFYQFPVIHRLLEFSRHSFPFTASSGVKFVCFIILSTFFPHWTSLHPRQRLPSGDHAIILLGHLLSSQCTTFRTVSTYCTVLPKLFYPYFFFDDIISCC
jgi:hypothetical protein